MQNRRYSTGGGEYDRTPDNPSFLAGNRLCRLRIIDDLKAAGVIHPGKKERGLFLLGLLLTLLLGGLSPDLRL